MKGSMRMRLNLRWIPHTVACRHFQAADARQSEVQQGESRYRLGLASAHCAGFRVTASTYRVRPTVPSPSGLHIGTTSGRAVSGGTDYIHTCRGPSINRIRYRLPEIVPNTRYVYCMCVQSCVGVWLSVGNVGVRTHFV